MEALNSMLIGYDQDLKISFLSQAAKKLKDIIGFNELYTMLIKILQDSVQDLRVVSLGNWQLEINKLQNYIAASSEKDTFFFNYSFDVIEHSIVKEQASVLVLNRIKDIGLQQELMKLEETYKAADNHDEIDKLKCEFFSNISHEFRTPLNIILGTQQLIHEHINKGNIHNMLENHGKYGAIINKNCYRLLRLVNNLIDISKIDAGYKAMEFTNLNIVSFVEDIVASVASYAESKNLDLIFDTDIEEKIMAIDGEKLERAILNLLSNAIKFTLPGGRITVNLYDGQDDFTISVKDTGVGIPRDKQQLIFERYKQLGAYPENCSLGSGIGLSLAKSLIEMHLGTINVISEINIGSEFLVNLPVMLVDSGEFDDQQQYKSDMNAYLNVELSVISSEVYDCN